MEEDGWAYFNEGKFVDFERIMGELVDYALEVGDFVDLATQDIVMLYIDRLASTGRIQKALAFLIKVVQVKEKLLGRTHQEVVEAFHLLPILLNRAKRYEEAVQHAE